MQKSAKVFYCKRSVAEVIGIILMYQETVGKMKDVGKIHRIAGTINGYYEIVKKKYITI